MKKTFLIPVMLITLLLLCGCMCPLFDSGNPGSTGYTGSHACGNGYVPAINDFIQSEINDSNNYYWEATNIYETAEFLVVEVRYKEDAGSRTYFMEGAFYIHNVDGRCTADHHEVFRDWYGEGSDFDGGGHWGSGSSGGSNSTNAGNGSNTGSTTNNDNDDKDDHTDNDDDAECTAEIIDCNDDPDTKAAYDAGYNDGTNGNASREDEYECEFQLCYQAGYIDGQSADAPVEDDPDDPACTDAYNQGHSDGYDTGYGFEESDYAIYGGDELHRDYLDCFMSGYDAGYIEGYKDGAMKDGHSDGREDGLHARERNLRYEHAPQFQEYYESSYDEAYEEYSDPHLRTYYGYMEGYDDGYEDGEGSVYDPTYYSGYGNDYADAYHDGYNSGFSDGKNGLEYGTSK